jgi:hypothetical protein
MEVNHVTIYDVAILTEALEENLSDDPYGTATYVIRNIIHRAIYAYGGTMSEGEHKNLVDIEEFTRRLDNA